MTVRNETGQPLNRLIFSLNDGLKVTSLKVAGIETSFSRQHHLIVIDENVALSPDEKTEVEMDYEGGINESLAYLDIDEEERLERYGKFVLNVDKRYAFLTPEYVLLTSEVNWYPKSGVTYSSEDVSWYNPQFTDFGLKVKTRPGLQAVSQGQTDTISPGEFAFQTEYPLTRLSLAIGNYELKSFEKDSIQFGIWHFEGHDFFNDALSEIQDTIPDLIAERLRDFQRNYNLHYAFDRMFLVEVPAQFKTFERIWTSDQQTIQPEQIFIPEKAFLIRAADFEGMKKRQRWGRRGDDNATPEEQERRVLNEFLETFTEEQQTDWQRGRGGPNVVQMANPYFIFPMLYNFQNNIQSDKWPITNRIFEAYLKSQVTDLRSGWMRNVAGMSEDERANITLQDSTFEQIISDPAQKRIIDNVIKLKGDVLFSMIEWKAGEEAFEEFLGQLLNEYRFRNISFEEFDSRINQKFGIELTPLMDDWFEARELPGYLFSPVEAVKVKSGNTMKTMVSLKMTNFSDIEGIVELSFRLGGGGRGRFRGGGPGNDDRIQKLVFLEPQQTKKVSYLLNGEPRMVAINTMTSQNIPQMIMDGFRGIEEDPNAVPFEGEQVMETPVQAELPNEIIVDNEDQEFKITRQENSSLLEKWILNEEKGTQKYSGMNYWRPPTEWTAVTNSDFYGEYVRSGYYIKSGDGTHKAMWYVPVKKPGYYDVFYHLYKSRRFGRRGGDNEKGEYQFIIHSEDGAEEQTLGIQNADEGWNHLGSFYFQNDTALIELTNKSEARLVFADAVKLVEL